MGADDTGTPRFLHACENGQIRKSFDVDFPKVQRGPPFRPHAVRKCLVLEKVLIKHFESTVCA